MRAKRGSIPRRPMTPDEITMARALAPARVRYVPGSADKSFARTLSFHVDQPDPLITARQGEYLVTLCIRMRRQLPADVLAIAERLSGRPLPAIRRTRRGVTAALLLLAILAGCSGWWTAGAGAAGSPCLSDRDSLRLRDSAGTCVASPRGVP